MTLVGLRIFFPGTIGTGGFFHFFCTAEKVGPPMGCDGCEEALFVLGTGGGALRASGMGGGADLVAEGGGARPPALFNGGAALPVFFEGGGTLPPLLFEGGGTLPPTDLLGGGTLPEFFIGGGILPDPAPPLGGGPGLPGFLGGPGLPGFLGGGPDEVGLDICVGDVASLVRTSFRRWVFDCKVSAAKNTLSSAVFTF